MKYLCWGIQENPSPSKHRVLTKFFRYVFQEQDIHDFRGSWTCEASGSQTHDFRGSFESVKTRVVNTRKRGTSNWQSHELRRTANSGIYRESGSEVMRGEIHESGKKQSQSCRLKKSGLRV
jgi:hypothetical protein